MIRRASRRARWLQWALLVCVVVLAGGIVHEAGSNLRARHLGFSYDYLSAPANFDIPFHLIGWRTTDSYGRVLLVGLLNTILVAVLGIGAATLLGLVVGIMRLSVNWLLRQLSGAFVEVVRNTPQLIQIVFWYVAVLQALPGPRQSLVIPPGILLNVRGLYVPSAVLADGAAPVLGAAFGLAIAGLAGAVWHGWRWLGLLPLAGLVAAFTVRGLDWPVAGGFNVRGGAVLPPELVALWLGLSIYSAAFIAEIVRGSIEAVPHGQTEAAQALGLRPGRVMVSVILPQAVRSMVPPLTSQYLNLVKSSSLGAAIAYPEIFQIFAGTAMNQSGREVETMTLVIAVFLGLSLLIAGLMNAYNRRTTVAQR